MKNQKKYKSDYFIPPEQCFDWVKKNHIESAPQWCSVDLRDGSQALTEPMTIREKTELFETLTQVGFKNIEISFPAASKAEFDFTRHLIENNLIPDDVAIQVLTQAIDHKIEKTFKAVEGAKKAIIHLYTSISPVLREQIFNMDKAEIKQLALDGVKQIAELSKQYDTDFSFEYSPEFFTQTEPEFSLDICNSIIEIWSQVSKNKVIINLPASVENVMPHVFASQIEYFSKNLVNRDNVVLSVQVHNDRGSAVAASECAVLAGAQRVEGTLFGNGERAGIADIVTMGLNLYSMGVDPGLDFSSMPKIVERYERCTGMHVYERAPYAGELVCSTFTASHQDAIAKSLKYREEHKCEEWNVPYLSIDPRDIGRDFESDIIRINSQSGKGGVAYILKRRFGLQIPPKMKKELSKTIKYVSNHEHKELTVEVVNNLFIKKYIDNTPVFTVSKTSFEHEGNISATTTLVLSSGNVFNIKSEGNGRLDAVSNALKKYFDTDYDIDVYEEHALTTGSTSKAVSYVCITSGDETYWGVGIDEDIIKSSIDALVVAVNQLHAVRAFQVNAEPRIIEMIDYIRDHYVTVTLDELAAQFYLSKQYISKYIKDKSGMTFCDNVQKVRMKKAEELLSTTSYNIEKVAELSGYPSVEHFNRRFKKLHGATPVQYRNQHKNQ